MQSISDHFPELAEKIKLAVLEGGRMALAAQSGVSNIGKTAEHLSQDTPEMLQRRSAKTLLDEQVQEIVLRAVIDAGAAEYLFLDAEEDTPLVRSFVNQDASVSLVIDPIDGTLEYLRGESGYSVCAGLFESGKARAVLVYFPSRRKLYSMEPDGISYETTYSDAGEVIERKELSIPVGTPQNVIYRNGRVTGSVVEKLTEAGYSTCDEANAEGVWSAAILKCAAGKYDACIFHTPQMRDILLAVICANVPGGLITDWEGRPIMWARGGRIPRVMFSVGVPTEKIIVCLKEE